MFFLFKLLGIFLIFQNSFNETHGSRCIIQNREYLEEYLFKSEEINGNLFFASTATLYPFDEVKDLNKVKWILLANTDGTFYIKNEDKNNPFLCSSDILDPFKKRRPIYTSSNVGTHCKWKLTKVNGSSEETEFYIRNVHYGEQLYAESFFLIDESLTFFSRLIKSFI